MAEPGAMLVVSIPSPPPSSVVEKRTRKTKMAVELVLVKELDVMEALPWVRKDEKGEVVHSFGAQDLLGTKLV